MSGRLETLCRECHRNRGGLYPHTCFPASPKFTGVMLNPITPCFLTTMHILDSLHCRFMRNDHFYGSQGVRVYLQKPCGRPKVAKKFEGPQIARLWPSYDCFHCSRRTIV